jgi:hypothetical protein
MANSNSPAYRGLKLLKERQDKWKDLATAKRSILNTARNITLFLTIVGAFVSTLAIEAKYNSGVPGETNTASVVLALIGSVCLGLVPIMKKAFLSPQKHDEWIRCRATARFMEKEMVLFKNNAGAYKEDVLFEQKDTINGFSGTDADEVAELQILLLTKKFKDLRDGVNDVKYLFAMKLDSDRELFPGRPSELTLTLKEDDFNMGPDDYVHNRLQTSYESLRYRAKRFAWEGSILQFFQYVFSGLAALSGFLSGTVGSNTDGFFSQWNVGVWAPVFTTAAASIANYIAERRPFELSNMFLSTAQQLEDLKLEYGAHFRYDDVGIDGGIGGGNGTFGDLEALHV